MTEPVKQKPKKRSSEMVVMKSEAVDLIANQIMELQKQGRLDLPKNYSVVNALNSAWLKMSMAKDMKGQPALDVCSSHSIQNALLTMCIQGLNPAKDQCYFVVYGDVLTLMTSYFGKVATLKQVAEIDDIFANVIYEGEAFEVEYGEDRKIHVKTHETKFGAQDNPIVGAYAVIRFTSGIEHTEVMTRKMIDASASMSKAKNSPAREKFPDQMALKSVLARATKLFLKSTADQNLLIETILQTNEQEYLDPGTVEQSIKVKIGDTEDTIEIDAGDYEVDADTGKVL